MEIAKVTMAVTIDATRPDGTRTRVIAGQAKIGADGSIDAKSDEAAAAAERTATTQAVIGAAQAAVGLAAKAVAH